MSTIGRVGRNQVFISYSHKDRKWLEYLLKMLKPGLRNRAAEPLIWDDTNIASGDKWREQIIDALASAKVAILLVSSDFLASDFISKHELPPILEAARKEGLRILWIYINECLYEETDIEAYQAVYDTSKPLDSLKLSARNKALKGICKKILHEIDSSCRFGLNESIESDKSLNTNALAFQTNFAKAKLANKTEKNLNSYINFSIPILGEVAAGGLVNQCISNGEDLILCDDPSLTQCYALRLTGESMVNAGILDKDIAIIRPLKDVGELKNGSIVAVWINGVGGLLKQFYRGHRATFRSFNPDYKDIEVDLTQHQVELQGVLVKLYRDNTFLDPFQYFQRLK